MFCLLVWASFCPQWPCDSAHLYRSSHLHQRQSARPSDRRNRWRSTISAAFLSTLTFSVSSFNSYAAFPNVYWGSVRRACRSRVSRSRRPSNTAPHPISYYYDCQRPASWHLAVHQMPGCWSFSHGTCRCYSKLWISFLLLLFSRNTKFVCITQYVLQIE